MLAFGLALLIVKVKDVMISDVPRADLYGHAREVTEKALEDFELSVHITNFVDCQWIPSNKTRSFELLGVLLRLILGVR